VIRLTLLLNPSATLDGSVFFAGCPSKIHAFAAVAEAEKRISSKRLALALNFDRNYRLSANADRC